MRLLALPFTLVMFAATVACSVPVGPDATDADDESAASAEEALSSSAKSLAGAYVTTAGALRAVAFRLDGTFAAEVEACPTAAAANCATTARVAGTFIAGPKTFTLRVAGASPAAARAIGRYAYTKGPAGRITLTRSGKTSSLDLLTDTTRLARAKLAILDYIEHVLVLSPAWISNLNGVTWNQVAARVQADVAAFETSDDYELFVDGETKIFVGRVNGLHTEATVDPLGKVTNLLVEID